MIMSVIFPRFQNLSSRYDMAVGTGFGGGIGVWKLAVLQRSTNGGYLDVA
jgi:hypothetical protein